MPELPDVAVYKRYFDSTALHQSIADAVVLDDQLLDGTSAATVRRALQGVAFEATRRHGKHLFARLSTGRWLALHFGMTGSLQYYKRADTAPEYGYFRVDFDNGYHLALVLPRKLGRVRIITRTPSSRRTTSAPTRWRSMCKRLRHASMGGAAWSRVR